jgi:H/ACA ribonucleoprotein complex subunit 3
MSKLLYCKNCGTYTLEKTCKKCKNKTISKNPPRFSPQDRYGEYRRKLKKLEKGVS